MAKKPDHKPEPPKAGDGDKAEENKTEASKTSALPETVTVAEMRQASGAKPPAEPEDTVTMNFKAPLKLNDSGAILSFHAGVNEVPARLQDHWYLKAHGVELYTKKKK